MGLLGVLETLDGILAGLKIRSEKSGEGSTPSRPTFRRFSGLFQYQCLSKPDTAKSAVGNHVRVRPPPAPPFAVFQGFFNTKVS